MAMIRRFIANIQSRKYVFVPPPGMAARIMQNSLLARSLQAYNPRKKSLDRRILIICKMVCLALRAFSSSLNTMKSSSVGTTVLSALLYCEKTFSRLSVHQDPLTCTLLTSAGQLYYSPFYAHLSHAQTHQQHYHGAIRLQKNCI